MHFFRENEKFLSKCYVLEDVFTQVMMSTLQVKGGGKVHSLSVLSINK